MFSNILRIEFLLLSHSVYVEQSRKILIRYTLMQKDRMPIDQREDNQWSELMLYKKIYGVRLKLRDMMRYQL